MERIYLDHAATTPVHPLVVEAMLPYFSGAFGNPSSLHGFGQEARLAVSRSRDRMAELLGCRPAELIFTSGGTESDNLALFGAFYAREPGKRHIVTTQVEHHAVLHACRRLEELGCEVAYVPVDETGRVSPDDIRAAIRSDTFLISVMYGNNEVGTLQPIREIGELARERGIAFHVDAVQALGAVELRLGELPVDLMSFSAHKINGPKGVGALYAARGTKIAPMLYGGSQERNRRSGTENVPGIVGFAKAAELALTGLAERAARYEVLRSAILEELTRQLGPGEFTVNGHPTERLPHILNVSFPRVPTETMLLNLDLAGVAASSGSACSSGSLETSHVLRAMRLPDSVLRSAVRFSFGYGNTPEDVKNAVERLETFYRKFRI